MRASRPSEGEPRAPTAAGLTPEPQGGLGHRPDAVVLPHLVGKSRNEGSCSQFQPQHEQQHFPDDSVFREEL